MVCDNFTILLARLLILCERAVPSIFDPDLSMNLSQHLFNIQLGRFNFILRALPQNGLGYVNSKTPSTQYRWALHYFRWFPQSYF